MKKRILRLNYELIRVHTMLRMILGSQKGRHLCDGNGGSSIEKPGSLLWDLITGSEFVKVVLIGEGVAGSNGGKMERGPKPPRSIFRGGGFGFLFLPILKFSYVTENIRGSMKKVLSKVLSSKLLTIPYFKRRC